MLINQGGIIWLAFKNLKERAPGIFLEKSSRCPTSIATKVLMQKQHSMRQLKIRLKRELNLKGIVPLKLFSLSILCVSSIWFPTGYLSNLSINLALTLSPRRSHHCPWCKEWQPFYESKGKRIIAIHFSFGFWSFSPSSFCVFMNKTQIHYNKHI